MPHSVLLRTLPVIMLLFSHQVVWTLFVTPWTVACQAPVSMGFSRQEYWSGLPCPPPEDLPDPRIKPESPALAGRFSTPFTESPGKTSYYYSILYSREHTLSTAWQMASPSNFPQITHLVPLGT